MTAWTVRGAIGMNGQIVYQPSSQCMSGSCLGFYLNLFWPVAFHSFPLGEVTCIQGTDGVRHWVQTSCSWVWATTKTKTNILVLLYSQCSLPLRQIDRFNSQQNANVYSAPFARGRNRTIMTMPSRGGALCDPKPGSPSQQEGSCFCVVL